MGIRDLPPKTRELYVLKGKAYLLLKRLSRAARRSFRDDPTTAAKFSLDLLSRKGGHRKAATPEPGPPAV